MKATLRPPSIRTLVVQCQSRGLLSGGRTFPSNWKTPLEPGPSSWLEESAAKSDSLDTKVKMKRRETAKCVIDFILEEAIAVFFNSQTMKFRSQKLFENESQILHNRHRYLILDVMIFNNFTGF